MIRNILVPVDGSMLSESILIHVRRLLLRAKATVTLLHVLPGEPHPTSEQERSALGYLTELRDRLSASGVSASSLLLNGEPASEILAFADINGPSLIAMSTHGRGGWKRWVWGSVAEQVLRHSGHPLLIASPNGLDDQRSGLHADIRRILVPLDDTDRSAMIIPMVREFATRYEAEALLLHTAPLQFPLDLPQPFDPAVHLDRAGDALREAGVSVRLRKEVGPADSTIVRVVEEECVDLVAMTTHGRRGLSRWVLGSVAESVLRDCTVPILLLGGECLPAGDKAKHDLQESTLGVPQS